jgi:hypothetical protein
MAPYDSESSDGEDNTVTNVLLGYTSNEAKDDTISHLGGRPVCSPYYTISIRPNSFTRIMKGLVFSR